MEAEQEEGYNSFFFFFFSSLSPFGTFASCWWGGGKRKWMKWVLFLQQPQSHNTEQFAVKLTNGHAFKREERKELRGRKNKKRKEVGITKAFINGWKAAKL